MTPLRILILAHPDLVPPDNMEELPEAEAYVWKTEYDVMKTLRSAGHEVSMLGVQTELAPIRDAVENWKPDIVFNLLEEFHGETLYAQNVVGLLELLRVPYTGLQSARPDAGARQGPVEETAEVSPRAGAGVCSVPDGHEGAPSGPSQISL